VFGQNGMDRPPQVANPFAVDEPHLKNAALATSRQVIGDKDLDVFRVERVQIQNTVDGQLNGLVHCLLKPTRRLVCFPAMTRARTKTLRSDCKDLLPYTSSFTLGASTFISDQLKHLTRP